MKFDWTDRITGRTVGVRSNHPTETQMARDAVATRTLPETPALEPSRAWILGLVVESDGSVSGPAPEHTLEWPPADAEATAVSTTRWLDHHGT